MEEIDGHVLDYLESLGFECWWQDEGELLITGMSEERKKTIMRGVARNV